MLPGRIAAAARASLGPAILRVSGRLVRLLPPAIALAGGERLGHDGALISVRRGAAQAVLLASDFAARLAIAQRLGGIGKAIGAAPRGSYIQVLFRHDRKPAGPPGRCRRGRGSAG
jgi:hypothetical protein